MPRVLVLSTHADGHVQVLSRILDGAGYAVEVRDHGAMAGRVPPDAVDYDLVVMDARAVTARPTDVVEFGDVTIGRLHIDAARRLVMVDGTPILMSARELRLLHHLAAHPDVVFSRDELLNAVWGPVVRTPGSVTEYVRRLRILLEPVGIGACIVTRKGFGYSFDSHVVR